MLNADLKFSAENDVSTNGNFVRRLIENLRENQNGFIEEFWRKIEIEKTPIFEEIEDDAENILCIFVFRGNRETQSVSVNLPPFSRLSPEDFQMSQIDETDIWFVSVKLPKASRFIYSFVVNCPFQTVNSESPKIEIESFRRALQSDFFNPNRLNETHSFVETPNAEAQKFLENKIETKRGKVEQFTIKSEILANERSVSIYTPPNFDASKTYPLIVLFDEELYLNEINAPLILDNLTAENLIPPVIAVFVGSVEREKELTGNPQFAEFISFELLDWLRKSYKIAESAKNKIIGGASFGGLAAVFTGLSHPETFGKILSQSGSFWRNPTVIFDKLSAQKSSNQIIYLDAGLYEIESKNGISLLDANRKLRDVLREKNFSFKYQEFKGGHGTINWRGTFADAIIFLTKDLTEKSNLNGNPNLF